MASMTTEPVFLMHGMKRSGNHALANWLMPQLLGQFVNNAIPLGPILRGESFPQPLEFKEWRRRRQGAAATDNLPLLVSLEDHQLTVLPFREERIDLRRILIVRYPQQLFSSRVRKASLVDMPAYPRDFGCVMQRAISIWKQHARCYLGRDTLSFPGRVAILFDAWFSNRDYRAAVSAALNLKFEDRGFATVSGEGGGSSFDGTSFDGRSSEMNVLDRVSQLDKRERALLDTILADPEMRQLSDAMRGADPYRLLHAA